VKLRELVGCLHATHAKSLDLRLSTLEPLNSGTMQIRVCKIGPVLFDYEYIRVYVSIISEPFIHESPWLEQVALGGLEGDTGVF